MSKSQIEQVQPKTIVGGQAELKKFNKPSFYQLTIELLAELILLQNLSTNHIAAAPTVQ